MEKYLMEKFKEILEKENNIESVKLYYNIMGNWVIEYTYNNEKYIIDIDMI